MCTLEGNGESEVRFFARCRRRYTYVSCDRLEQMRHWSGGYHSVTTSIPSSRRLPRVPVPQRHCIQAFMFSLHPLEYQSPLWLLGRCLDLGMPVRNNLLGKAVDRSKVHRVHLTRWWGFGRRPLHDRDKGARPGVLQVQLDVRLSQISVRTAGHGVCFDDDCEGGVEFVPSANEERRFRSRRGTIPFQSARGRSCR